MTTQKDRIEAAIRHIQTASDIDPWAMELAVDALKAQGTCEDAVSRQTRTVESAQNVTNDELISKKAAIDAVQHAFDRETLLNNFVRKVAVDALKTLPSAQPVLDRTKISDLLEKIYSIQSVHLSAEGVIAKKYFCEELWKEIFGSEAELPAWLRVRRTDES